MDLRAAGRLCTWNDDGGKGSVALLTIRRLLAYLAHHKGRVVSRTELVEHLYDQDFDRDSNTIEVFVGRLRKKLGINLIQTLRGLGYKLDETAADSEANAAH
jgi:DNA-binding response OmpR family regulator